APLPVPALPQMPASPAPRVDIEPVVAGISPQRREDAEETQRDEKDLGGRTPEGNIVPSLTAQTMPADASQVGAIGKVAPQRPSPCGDAPEEVSQPVLVVAPENAPPEAVPDAPVTEPPASTDPPAATPRIVLEPPSHQDKQTAPTRPERRRPVRSTADSTAG